MASTLSSQPETDHNQSESDGPPVEASSNGSNLNPPSTIPVADPPPTTAPKPTGRSVGEPPVVTTEKVIERVVVEKPKRSVMSRIWGFLKTIFWLLLIPAAAAAGWFGYQYFNDEVIDQRDAQAAQLTELQEQVTALDSTATDGLPMQIEALSSDLAALTGRTDAVEAAQADLQAAQADLDAAIVTQTERIDALNEAQVSLSGETNSRLDVSRAVELLSRSRLFLYQANYGLAVDDIERARDLIADTAATDQLSAEALSQVVDRLDSALGALPELPVLAADELDIAWQILIDGSSIPSVEDETATTDEDATGEGATDETTTDEGATDETDTGATDTTADDTTESSVAPDGTTPSDG